MGLSDDFRHPQSLSAASYDIDSHDLVADTADVEIQRLLHERMLASSRVDVSIEDAATAICDFGTTKARERSIDAILIDPRATLGDVRVYWQYARATNSHLGLAWPSDTTIAARTGLAISTVRNIKVDLHKWGYLARSGVRTKKSTRFALTPPWGMSWRQLDEIMGCVDKLQRLHKKLRLHSADSRSRHPNHPASGLIASTQITQPVISSELKSPAGGFDHHPAGDLACAHIKKEPLNEPPTEAEVLDEALLGDDAWTKKGTVQASQDLEAGASRNRESSAARVARATQEHHQVDLWFCGRYLKIPRAKFEAWCAVRPEFRERPDILKNKANACEDRLAAGEWEKLPRRGFDSPLAWFEANWLTNAGTEAIKAVAATSPTRDLVVRTSIDGLDPADFRDEGD